MLQCRGKTQCAGCTASSSPPLTCRLDGQGDVHAAADPPREGVEVRQPLVLAEALHQTNSFSKTHTLQWGFPHF
jgi:hypothetical protein